MKLEFTLSCPDSPPSTISGAIYSMVPQTEKALSAYFLKTKPNIRKTNMTQNRDKILYPNRRCILIFLCICNEEVRSGYISILMKKYL